MASQIKPQYDVVLQTPVGKLGFVICDGTITQITYLGHEAKCHCATQYREVAKQFNDYFSGKRQDFSLAFQTSGTPFERKVQKALYNIPYGKTRSYGALAAKLGTSARAIGNACRSNPLTLLVPCHRIIRTDGTIGGYSGATRGEKIARKQWLLDLEKAHANVNV